MQRVRTLIATAFALVGSSLLAVPGVDLPPTYRSVTIAPSTSSILIGFVTLSMGTFTRATDTYASSYSAKVFPYFWWNEQGRIYIEVTDGTLARLQKGEPVDFVGHSVCDNGGRYRITGHAVPTDADGGNIKVRVIVTRFIVLSFDTTYRLAGR